MKKAFIFPGQGAQAVGMGLEIAENYGVAKRVFENANEILGFSLSDLIKNGPAEELKKTVNTQPAVVCTSIALLEVLRDMGLSCEMTAGHSVGEFSALYCAGVLSLESCLDLTRARGEFMHEAGEKYPGTLAALIGVDEEKAEEICQKASQKGIVVVANLNCPGQVVISGSMEGIEEAGKVAVEMGAKKVVTLEVSAAFHSPLMDEAAKKLAEKLDKVEFKDAAIPVIANVTGKPVIDGNEIRELMKVQISSQVLWEKSMRYMKENGVELFVEIGPGKVLSGMLKRIDRKMPLCNFNDMNSLKKLTDKLNLQPVGV